MSIDVESRLSAIEQRVQRFGEMLHWLMGKFLSGESKPAAAPEPANPAAPAVVPLAALPSGEAYEKELRQIQRNMALLSGEDDAGRFVMETADGREVPIRTRHGGRAEWL